MKNQTGHLDKTASAVAPSNKVQDVRSFFEEPRNYLGGRDVQIALRADTVREYADAFEFHSVLDIGCGDGSISVPLLRQDIRLTLLDLSTKMTLLAGSKVPEMLARNVEYVNDDFMNTSLGEHSYDLVICLGVLAHLDSPTDFLAKVATVLKPGGRLILEFSDSNHFVGRALRAYQCICALRKPRKWSLNSLSFDAVNQMLTERHLGILSVFRYSLPPLPVINKQLSPDVLYKYVRRIFGNVVDNRNAGLGSEYICLVQKL